MIERARVEALSWDLFHLDCPHEWRNKGEPEPPTRNRCGDCVRESLLAYGAAIRDEEREACRKLVQETTDLLRRVQAQYEENLD